MRLPDGEHVTVSFGEAPAPAPKPLATTETVEGGEAWKEQLDASYAKMRKRLLSYVEKISETGTLYPYEPGDILSMAYEKAHDYLAKYPDKRTGSGRGLLAIATRQTMLDARRDQSRIPSDLTASFNEYSDKMLSAHSGADGPLKGEEAVGRSESLTAILDANEGRVAQRFQRPVVIASVMNNYLLGFKVDDVARLYLKEFQPESENDPEAQRKTRELVGKLYQRTVDRAAEELAC